MATRRSHASSDSIPTDTPLYRFVDPQKKHRLKTYRGRGKAYIDHAIAFAHRFPLDTPFSIAIFDAWAAERDIYQIPHGADKTSDAWMAMLRRRDQLMNGLRAAAETEDMEQLEVRAYYIERTYNNFMRVLPSTHVKDGSKLGLEKVVSVATRHRQKLQDALHAFPVEKQHHTWKLFARLLYNRYLSVETDLEKQLNGLNQDFLAIQDDIREQVALKQISATDPFVRAFLTSAGAPLAFIDGAPDDLHTSAPLPQRDDAGAHVPLDEEQPYC
jgi:hypothetical protein